ncbi:MAG: MFS transporter, partial [Lactobacillus iners]|nr:MFS transporter [Lactobacillus iners]
YWRQTLAGTAFYATQSFAFFGINIFLPILLKSMDVTDTYLAGLFYNIATVAGPAIGIYFFNIYRRRSFLIVTFSISSLCLFILAFGKSINSIIEITIFTLLAVILTASVLLDFPYTSELFDIKLRGTGVGFVIAMSRIGAALGTFLLPVVVSAYGSYVTMAICGVVLLLGTVICYFVAPETNPRYVNKD